MNDEGIAVEEILVKYKNNIGGVIGCYDRVIINGSFNDIAHPGNMSWQLKEAGLQLLDYGKKFANVLRMEMRDKIETLANDEGLHIEFVN